MRAHPNVSHRLTAAAIAIAAGSAGAAPELVQASPGSLVGHFYIKVATGETVFTPAQEYLANKAGRRTIGDDLTGDGVGDVWVAINADPCGLGTPTSPSSFVALLDTDITQGDQHLYKAHSASGDVRVESLTWSHWTNVLDTDNNADFIPDGNTRGHGFELTFWDNEDPAGLGSSAPYGRTRIVTFEFTNMPGPLTAPLPNFVSGFVLTFDLTGFEFEIADTDGFGPATGFFNAFAGADTNSDTFADDDHDANGTHDWSHSVRAIQPSNPNPGEGAIGYQVAAPGITGPPNTGDPNDGVIDFSGELILAGSVVEPMGKGGIEFFSGALGEPVLLGRFSSFPPGTDPDPAGPSGGAPASDFNAFGGGLECTDFDGDTIIDAPFYTHPYLALSGDRTGEPPCDCDDSGTLNIDDIDCFVAAFLSGNALAADCTGDGVLNLDDIDCFVACFLGG